MILGQETDPTCVRCGQIKSGEKKKSYFLAANLRFGFTQTIPVEPCYSTETAPKLRGHPLALVGGGGGDLEETAKGGKRAEPAH